MTLPFNPTISSPTHKSLFLALPQINYVFNDIFVPAIETESDSRYVTTVEARDGHGNPQLFAMVETQRHEMVLYEIPAGLLYTNSHDPPPNFPVLTNNEIIVMYKAERDSELPNLTMPNHVTAPFSPPRMCRPLFTLAQQTTSLPVGVIETKWSLSRNSSPGPYCRMDNRRRPTSAAYINTVRLSYCLSATLRSAARTAAERNNVEGTINLDDSDMSYLEETASLTITSEPTMMSVDEVYEDYMAFEQEVHIGRMIGESIASSLLNPPPSPARASPRLTGAAPRTPRGSPMPPRDSPRPPTALSPPSLTNSHLPRPLTEIQAVLDDQGVRIPTFRPRRPRLARNPAKVIRPDRRN